MDGGRDGWTDGRTELLTDPNHRTPLMQQYEPFTGCMVESLHFVDRHTFAAGFSDQSSVGTRRSLAGGLAALAECDRLNGPCCARV